MADPLVLVAPVTPGITCVTLNRADKRNALSVDLLEALVAAIDRIERDSKERVLLLTGAGPVFCAGLDLAEAADPAKAHRSSELMAEVLRRLAESRLITIAVVRGVAVAGGAGLVSACDLAFAEETAQIGYPETRRGLVAALVMTFLRRQLHERDARALLLTGEMISAQRAAEIGLVNAAAPSSDLLPTALKSAQAILEGAPEAVTQTKRLWNSLWPTTLESDLNQAMVVHRQMRQSAEIQEGIAAFKEKRCPKWAPESDRSAP